MSGALVSTKPRLDEVGKMSTRSSHTEVGSLKGEIEQRDGVIYEGREPRIGHRASHQGPQEKQRHECRREEKKRGEGPS